MSMWRLLNTLNEQAGLRELAPQIRSCHESDVVEVCAETPAKQVFVGTWDADYIRWLEDPDITIGKDLRLEIAARLKELIAEPALHAGS